MAPVALLHYLSDPSASSKAHSIDMRSRSEEAEVESNETEHVDIDLSDVFAAGHSYVALGRGVSLEGVHVQNFSPDKFWADQRFRVKFHADFISQALKISILIHSFLPF
jgi:hypothetical protein